MRCEEQLVQCVLAGDQEAFREIVDLYKAYVFSIVLQFVKDRYEAENIAQEIFLQVYRSLSHCRMENFKAWVGRIAANKAIDYCRARAKSTREVSLTSYLEKTGEVQDAGRLGPEELVLLEEERERIRGLCCNLPSPYRDSAVKHYLEGKSCRQIAREEGIPVKTVESRLYRARLLIRKKWEEGEHEALQP